MLVATLLGGCELYDPSLLPKHAYSPLDDGMNDAATEDGDGHRLDAAPPDATEGGAADEAGMRPATDDASTPTDDASAADGSSEAGASPEADASSDAGGDAQTSEPDADVPPDGGADDAQPSDGCPDDPDKATPGQCGCGIPESGDGSCTGLLSSLRHRYTFEDAGGTLADSVGNSDGSLTNATLASGVLVLQGGATDGYATLPGGLLSGLSEATVELWVTWNGGAPDQHLLSLGTATPETISTTAQPNCGRTAEYDRGSWYVFCGQSSNWNTARNHCEGAGGCLVAIDDATEQQYLETRLTAGSWIGANDRQVEGDWAWARVEGDSAGGRFWTGDATGSVEPGAYANWRAQQPDNSGGEHCAYLSYTDFAWNDNDCVSSTWAFVCEWRGHRGSDTENGLWFTPDAGGGASELRLRTGGDETDVAGPPFPTGTLTHVALVLAPDADGLSLYVDGAHFATVSTGQALSDLRDVDAWVGRSHVGSDPGWSGSVHELRIYDRALSDAEVATSHALGSDPTFLD